MSNSIIEAQITLKEELGKQYDEYTMFLWDELQGSGAIKIRLVESKFGKKDAYISRAIDKIEREANLVVHQSPLMCNIKVHMRSPLQPYRFQ